MSLKRKNIQNINENNEFLDTISNVSMSKKKIEEFVYMGKRKYRLVRSVGKFDHLHKYITHCFDSIYPLVMTPDTKIDLDEAPYTVILQFLYAMAEFNGKLNFRQPGRNKPVLTDTMGNLHKISYKVLTTASVMRAECMWLDDCNTIIFNEKLIKATLNAKVSAIDLEIDNELKQNFVCLPSYLEHATDIITIPPELLTKLSILFSIAEHFAIHLFENNNDYIQHTGWSGVRSITTLSAIILIRPIGRLDNTEKLMNNATSQGIMFHI